MVSFVGSVLSLLDVSSVYITFGCYLPGRGTLVNVAERNCPHARGRKGMVKVVYMHLVLISEETEGKKGNS